MSNHLSNYLTIFFLVYFIIVFPFRIIFYLRIKEWSFFDLLIPFNDKQLSLAQELLFPTFFSKNKGIKEGKEKEVRILNLLSLIHWLNFLLLILGIIIELLFFK